MKDATDIINSKTRYEQVSEYMRDTADWFHNHEGSMFERENVVNKISDDLDIDKTLSNDIVSELVSDRVDPVVQVVKSGTRYVGEAEYVELEGAYGYVDYHDILGPRKRVVCAQCVHEADTDGDVATRELDKDEPYTDTLASIREHYQDEHDGIMPTDVETGASLLSGTTVGGNTAWHDGNVTNNDGYIDISSTSLDLTFTPSTFDYNQSTDPSDSNTVEPGETWWDTSEDEGLVRDSWGWKPLVIKPGDVDRVETWSESNVTVTTDEQTRINDSEFIELWEGPTIYEDTETHSLPNSWTVIGSYTQDVTNISLIIFEVDYYNNGDGLQYRVNDLTNSNEAYYFESGGSGTRYGTYDVTSYTGNIDFEIEGYGDFSYDHEIQYQHHYQKALNGTVTVEWDSVPTYYSDWGRVILNQNRDGANINAYVDEDQSGTWTEVTGPIQDGERMLANPDNDTRIRIELDRPNPKDANYPTVEAAYREYEL